MYPCFIGVQILQGFAKTFGSRDFSLKIVPLEKYNHSVVCNIFFFLPKPLYRDVFLKTSSSKRNACCSALCTAAA